MCGVVCRRAGGLCGGLGANYHHPVAAAHDGRLRVVAAPATAVFLAGPLAGGSAGGGVAADLDALCGGSAGFGGVAVVGRTGGVIFARPAASGALDAGHAGLPGSVGAAARIDLPGFFLRTLCAAVWPGNGADGSQRGGLWVWPCDLSQLAGGGADAGGRLAVCHNVSAHGVVAGGERGARAVWLRDLYAGVRAVIL